MRTLPIIFIVVILVIVGGAFWAVQQSSFDDAMYSLVDNIFDGTPSDDATAVQFVVDQGDSASDIANKLEQQRLIRSAWLFNFLAKKRDADDNLEAGVYSLRRNMTTDEVLDELTEGHYTGVQVTFPEGWRATEMAALLDTKNVVSGQEFLQLAAKGDARYDFLKGLPSNCDLEGYLFPDTYRTPPGTTAKELIAQMLQNFDQKFTSEMRQQASARSLTIHQVVTLASIVEREAQVASERSIIAGVFLNRLKAGMLLQADSTVQYAKAEKQSGSALVIDYWPKGLTETDLQIDSPYNTYQTAGLPPGPICNPGLASIKAVIEAPATDYYYFVAKEDGSHVFAKTLAEHNANVEKYQIRSGQ